MSNSHVPARHQIPDAFIHGDPADATSAGIEVTIP